MTAWGKLIATTGSLANTVGANQPFRYRGYVYDEETGWYYLQSRYYDPTTCRFISADVLLSTGQGVIGHNAFAYCLNNPANYHDSEGNYPTRDDGSDGLPSHEKKGTTNPSNLPKHQRGLARKDRDKNKKEKGDKKRKQRNGKRNRPNKSEYSIPSYSYSAEYSVDYSDAGTIALGIALILLIADDFACVGVADDEAIPVVFSALLASLGI